MSLSLAVFDSYQFIFFFALGIVGMKPPGAISAKHRSEAESRIARPPEGGTPITYYTIAIYSIFKSLVFYENKIRLDLQITSNETIVFSF